MPSEVDVEDFLAHYGVKGMKWGIRRDRSSVAAAQLAPPKGVEMRPDGSISVQKGASLQRLVRSNGESKPMEGLTFASLNDYDNARYIKSIGGKGVLGGGRDQILGLTAAQPIKAPSVKEASEINSRLMMKDAAYKSYLTHDLSPTGDISKGDWSRIQADPSGKTAQAWYEVANRALTYGEDYSPGVTSMQTKLSSAIKDKGYNALRDENDFGSKIAKAPIIIFNPEKSLKVTTVTDITDSLRKSNKAQLKQYKKAGKDWVDIQLYKQ